MIGIRDKPFLEHLILSVKKVGIKEIFLVVGERREIITRYFGNGEKLGLKLSYVVQEQTLGTADAIYRSRDFLKNEKEFLVIYGDIFITSWALSELINRYEETRARAVLAVAQVENPERYAVVIKDDDMIIGLVEKPMKPPSNFVMTGAMILTESVFKYIEKLKPSIRGELEITDALAMMVHDKLPIYAIIIDPKDWGHLDVASDLIKLHQIIEQSQ
jgi:dTDP-glucose pyrophosphorylase